jgi:hypothetical protein
MSVGIPIDKASLDNTAGSTARSLFAAFANVQRIKAFLDATPDVTLQAQPYGYTAGEIAILKSSYTDLNNLAVIFNGSASGLSLPRDHRTFAAQIIGILY